MTYLARLKALFAVAIVDAGSREAAAQIVADRLNIRPSTVLQIINAYGTR